MRLLLLLTCVALVLAGEELGHLRTSSSAEVSEQSEIHITPENEPENLGLDKAWCKKVAAVIEYFGKSDGHIIDETSAYFAEVRRVTTEARKHVTAFLESKEHTDMRDNGVTPVFIFDIDDTVLSNYAYSKAAAFCWEEDLFQEMASRSLFPSITPTQELMRFCANNYIIPVFLTARPHYQAELSRIQLQGAGLRAGQDYWGGLLGWGGHAQGADEISGRIDERVGYQSVGGVIFRNHKSHKAHSESAQYYKSNVRARLERDGLPGVGKVSIIGSVGDQWTDLRGGSVKMTVKLPNPTFISN